MTYDAKTRLVHYPLKNLLIDTKALHRYQGILEYEIGTATDCMSSNVLQALFLVETIPPNLELTKWYLDGIPSKCP